VSEFILRVPLSQTELEEIPKVTAEIAKLFEHEGPTVVKVLSYRLIWPKQGE
jgi:hypothetical protein